MIFIFASFCEVGYTLDVYELITVDSFVCRRIL